MDLIIDGYNLIFQCGLVGRSADSLALERARNRLVRELNRFVENSGPKTRCTVVFDAKQRPVKASAHDYSVGRVKILFAAEYDEADSLIEQLIRSHSAPRQLVVVSSDHRLHKAARSRRAVPVDSDQWYDEHLESPVPVEPPQAEQPAEPQLSAEETAALACKFQMSDQDLKQLIDEIDEEHPRTPDSDQLGLDRDLIEELDGDLDQLNPFPPGYGEELLD